MRAMVAALTAVPFFFGTAACAVTYPDQPNGPVFDQAAIIPAASELALDTKLRRYFAKTCRAVVVATVSSLGGETVDDYAMNLGNHWRIGDPVRGDGVLLLVAPNERQVRLEVSQSLQPAMPDSTAADIIRGRMMERFRKGDFDGGITVAVNSITKHLNRFAPRNRTCNAKAGTKA